MLIQIKFAGVNENKKNLNHYWITKFILVLFGKLPTVYFNFQSILTQIELTGTAHRRDLSDFL